MATQAIDRKVSAAEGGGVDSSDSRNMNPNVKPERIDSLRSLHPQSGHPYLLHPSQNPSGLNGLHFQQQYGNSITYPPPRDWAGYDYTSSRRDNQYGIPEAGTLPWLSPTDTAHGAATHYGQSIVSSDHQPTTAYPATFYPGQTYTGSGPLDQSNETSGQAQKRRKPDDRRAGKVEVEAGLALAGMGRTFDGLQAGDGDVGLVDPIPKLEPSDRPIESPKRSNLKKGKSGDEIKAKKTNQDGKKSCAECRRLKAKCDRVFPCSNCRKRGCALVCPDGDLSCMQGKRLVLASTEQLHERISELEAALAQAHRGISASTSHPLLSTAHLDGGLAVKTSQSPSHTSSQDHSPTKLANQDLHRLSPDQRSSSRSSFVLQTPQQALNGFADGERRSRMAVESLLIDEDSVGTEGKKGDQWVGENAAPALIIGDTADTDNLDHIDRQATLERLRSILRCLPDRETTRRQATRFFAQSTWYQNILRSGEFETIYEPAVYAPTPSNPLTPHKLACVLMVLTLDTYLDVGGSQDSPLVAEYWDGVQQCFDTRFGWGSSIAGVQALGLVSLFVGFGWRGSGASNFYWLRKMTSAAQQLGLHKDPHPALPLAERTFRRRVFHELYTLDCLMSINHGQRTAIPLDNIETKYPEDGMALPRLKYIYMGHVKSEVIEIGCAPDRVPMSELEERVQKVGKLLEQYSVKASPGPHCPVLSGEPILPPPTDPGLIDVPNLTRCTTSMCHFKALLFLYRPSFRRLIARLRPTDPSQATLSESERNCLDQTFLASSSIIAVSGFFASREPRLATRIWSTWVQTFSASVSLAALAIWGGPFLGEGFVRRAYDEMRGGCDMIRAHGCQRAQGVLALLPILCNLVENRYPVLVGLDRPINPAIQQGEDMLFILLGGQVDQQPSTVGETLYKPPAATPHKSGQSIAINAQAQVHWQSPILFSGTGVSLGPSNPVPPQWLNTLDSFPTGQTMSGSQIGTSGSYTVAPSDPYYVPPDQQALCGMDAAEVWARLQTFYEPAVAPPVWQGQGVGNGAVYDPFGIGNWGFQASGAVDE